MAFWRLLISKTQNPKPSPPLPNANHSPPSLLPLLLLLRQTSLFSTSFLITKTPKKFRKKAQEGRKPPNQARPDSTQPHPPLRTHCRARRLLPIPHQIERLPLQAAPPRPPP
ncbi:hypothetical protein ACFX2B_043387 [Malus domestica]